MSKHTPGPWKIDGPKAMNIQCNIHRVINDDRFPAAFVPAWDQPAPGEEDGTEEARANARLIAAAPDLLEALKALRDAVEASKKMNGREYIDLGIQVNAAIAKAEGRP